MSNPIVPLMAIMANLMEKEELVKAVQEKCTECNNLYLSGKKKEADEVFAHLGMYCQMILLKRWIRLRGFIICLILTNNELSNNNAQ